VVALQFVCKVHFSPYNFSSLYFDTKLYFSLFLVFFCVGERERITRFCFRERKLLGILATKTVDFCVKLLCLNLTRFLGCFLGVLGQNGLKIGVLMKKIKPPFSSHTSDRNPGMH